MFFRRRRDLRRRRVLATPSTRNIMNRRTFLLAAAAVPFGFSARSAFAESLPLAVIHHDPLCGCCGAWVEHLVEAGFPVDIRETSELNRIKSRLGVPGALASCHTAEIDGYVVEGHVPAGAIKRLLAERPSGRGLSVPGMPIGSPGMEVEGMEDDTYDVVLFGATGHETFARYRGGELLG
jgi:hypothetical protein